MSFKAQSLKLKVQNALTFDVEEHFQVANFEQVVNRQDWDDLESRVKIGLEKILRILEENNIKATFFVLGWIAERCPNVVQDIYKCGHEVATHGYDHKLIYNQGPAEFEKTLKKSIKIIEGIIQDKIVGHRGASFSITKSSLWSLEVLANCGLKYDASIFPITHHRYGIPGAQRFPYTINLNGSNRTILEFPCSTIKLLGKNIPFSGGGYFRLLPYSVISHCIKKLNQANRPVIVYLHPWELDSEQPRIKADWISQFRHYVNIDRTEQKLQRLLKDFAFTTIKEVLGI